MGDAGHRNGQLQRVFESGNLLAIRAHARELERVPLGWALLALRAIAAQEPETYERAAVRFLARLAGELPVDLADLAVAVGELDRLPDDPSAMRRLDGLLRRVERQG